MNFRRLSRSSQSWRRRRLPDHSFDVITDLRHAHDRQLRRLPRPLGRGSGSSRWLPGGQECGGHELIGVARTRHRDFDHLAQPSRVRVENQDTIRQVDRLFEIVGDEDDGDVDLLPDLQEVALHLRARLGVERAERLVHQQNARPVGECAGDGDALLHSTRKLVRVGVGEAFEPDQVDPLARLALRALTRTAS